MSMVTLGNSIIIGEYTEVNIGHIGPNQNIETSPQGEFQYFGEVQYGDYWTAKRG